MAEKSDFDPIAAWQGFVSQWERQINDMSASLSANETFAGSMNQFAKLSFAARKNVEDHLDRLARSAQLPTQAQISEVLDRLDRIEQKIDALALAVVQTKTAAAPSTAQPRRTRQPPDSAT
ncbi:hypothetical protein ACFB49_16900 [Sphingomonas sp. DBB INV C78]|uniref:hypothetical protein n=1 Tax=Sphingomonas sp. DBB INV C78 TaxID=3349434 RepID=UPI0036D398A3